MKHYDPKVPTTAEEVFDECAKRGMIKYDLREFKRTHPTLFAVIIQAMRRYAAIRKNDLTCEHNFVSSVAYKGGRVCSKCGLLK